MIKITYMETKKFSVFNYITEGIADFQIKYNTPPSEIRMDYHLWSLLEKECPKMTKRKKEKVLCSNGKKELIVHYFIGIKTVLLTDRDNNDWGYIEFKKEEIVDNDVNVIIERM